MKTKLISLILLAGMIILSSCYKLPDTDNIVMPTWDIEGIHLPLVSQSKTIEEILEDDSTFAWYPENNEQSPGVLYFSKKENIEGTTVGEHLKLDQISASASAKIGAVSITDTPTVKTNISISDWTPFAAGQSVIIPSFRVSNQETPFGNINAFQLIELKNGRIRITIDNNLPVYVIYSNLQIMNNNGSGTVITMPIPDIPLWPNTTKVVEVEIEKGIAIASSIKSRVDIYTSGSSLQFVTLSEDAGTLLTMELLNIEISRVVAAIPENVISINSSFTIDSGDNPVELAMAEISGGSLLLNLQNNIDIDALLDITLPDLYDNQGNKYNVLVTVPRAGNLQYFEPDMSGWKIEPSEMTNQLRYSVTASYISTASDDYREISENDSFNVSVQLNELTFSKFDGIFSTEFQMEEQTFSIDYGDVFDKFEYQEIKLTDSFIYLDLLTSAFLPVNINNAILTASNGLVTNSISIGQISLPSPVAINVSELFEGMTQIFPTDFTFNGSADVNPANERIVVADTDSIYGSADIQIPLTMMIAGGSFTEIFELDIADDIKEEITNIKRVSLTFEIENEIPVNISLVASVLDMQGQSLLKIPTLTNAIEKIEVSAPLLSADGTFIEAGQIIQTIELTGEDVLKFIDGDRIELLFQFETAETDDDIVQFRFTDRITYRAFGEVDYKFEN